MSDLILIQPTAAEIVTPDGPIIIREVQLGGVPRGIIVLLTEADSAEVDVVERLNEFALEGYESLAAAPGREHLPDILERVRQRGWDEEQVGVVGIGDGGTLALHLAQERQLGAVVSFSPAPNLDAIARDPQLRTPWLGMVGAEATDLDGVDARRMRKLLDDGSDIYSRVVIYPGVGREFHRRSGDGVSYAASYDGWERTTEWLNARVAARLTPLAAAWRRRQALSPIGRQPAR
jgi:carboxymethylenebutenolidase